MVVVAHELGEQSEQMPLIQHDDVVKALLAKGPHYPFRDRVRATQRVRAAPRRRDLASGPLSQAMATWSPRSCASSALANVVDHFAKAGYVATVFAYILPLLRLANATAVSSRASA